MRAVGTRRWDGETGGQNSPSVTIASLPLVHTPEASLVVNWPPRVVRLGQRMVPRFFFSVSYRSASGVQRVGRAT